MILNFLKGFITLTNADYTIIEALKQYSVEKIPMMGMKIDGEPIGMYLTIIIAGALLSQAIPIIIKKGNE